jgi:GNAT superfamily N-acetyltransferase
MSEAANHYNLHPLRFALYPELDWPEVGVEPHPEPSLVATADKHILTVGGDRAGEAIVVRPGTGDRYLTRLVIDAPHRRQGLGMAALARFIDYAHEEGTGFRTDPVGEYPGVARLWNILAKKGVAEVIHPFEPLSQLRHGGDVCDLQKGWLRVPLPAELTLVTSTD